MPKSDQSKVGTYTQNKTVRGKHGIYGDTVGERRAGESFDALDTVQNPARRWGTRDGGEQMRGTVDGDVATGETGARETR